MYIIYNMHISWHICLHTWGGENEVERGKSKGFRYSNSLNGTFQIPQMEIQYAISVIFPCKEVSTTNTQVLHVVQDGLPCNFWNQVKSEVSLFFLIFHIDLQHDSALGSSWVWVWVFLGRWMPCWRVSWRTSPASLALWWLMRRASPPSGRGTWVSAALW